MDPSLSLQGHALDSPATKALKRVQKVLNPIRKSRTLFPTPSKLFLKRNGRVHKSLYYPR